MASLGEFVNLSRFALGYPLFERPAGVWFAPSSRASARVLRRLPR
jgi:hypothetical protein